MYDLKFFTYGTYVWFPVLATLVWLADLLTLLLLWLVPDNSERYRSSEPDIVFISDVGAAHKAVFITLNTVTVVFYVLSMFAERWLRSVDRIPSGVRSRERTFDILAICFAVVGGAALILLAIFDAFNHSGAHWSLTIVFIVCVAFSAIFQTGEVWSLHKDHPDRRHLLRNSALKWVIVCVAILAAIAFASLYGYCSGPNEVSNHGGRCNRILSAAAVLEWSIALLFDAYLATLVLDLWPAAKTSPRHQRRLEKHEAQMREKGLLSEDATALPSPAGSEGGVAGHEGGVIGNEGGMANGDVAVVEKTTV